MKIGEYKTLKISSSLRLKELMGIDTESFVYALFKKNCIELRTKEQYEFLLRWLDNKIKSCIDSSEIAKYKKYKANVIGYSKFLELYENYSVYFGYHIINHYNLRDGAIIEKCSDCIKIWNSSLFKIKHAEDNNKKYRR